MTAPSAPDPSHASISAGTEPQGKAAAGCPTPSSSSSSSLFKVRCSYLLGSAALDGKNTSTDSADDWEQRRKEGGAGRSRSEDGDDVRRSEDWFEIVDGGNYTAGSTGEGKEARRVEGLDSASATAGEGGRRIPAFNFSFAMGGWLMFYSFGVAKCLLDHGLHKVRRMEQRVIGSSAGSLAATALILEADIDKIVDQAKTSFIPRAHAARFLGFVYGMFYIGRFLKESMLACLPVARVPGHTSPPGRLTVVMSSVLGWKSVRAEEFEDGADLIDALRSSCACFPLVMPHVFRGRRCFDGFFSEGASAPVLDEEEAGGLPTVTISPLYASSASIRPSRYVPLSWIALPPNDPGAIDWLYDLGYRDALFWMAKEGIGHTCSHVLRFSERKDAVVTAAAASPATRTPTAPITPTSGNDVFRAGILAPESGGGKQRREKGLEETDKKGGNEHHSNGDKEEDRSFYLRPSFALSTCHMRPRRGRHPALDAPRFVPSLEKFVGHGSYHAAADFAFVVFFNVVWRPAAAVLLLADLLVRLLTAVLRGLRKDIRPQLWWLVPTLLLAGVAREDEERSSSPPSRPEAPAAVVVVAVVTAVVAVGLRALLFGDGAGREEWREAGCCLRALLDFRRVLVDTLLPWTRGRGRGVEGGGEGRERGGGPALGGEAGLGAAKKSEALERSFVYRAASFFM